MLHTAVQVAGEGVLYQERGEVECPQHQLLAPHGLRPGLVTGEDPGPGSPDCGALQDLITEVQDVDPVEELTLA